MSFDPACLTTGIGSLPGNDASLACSLILEYFDIPYWPQLPVRSSDESLPQFFEGFPGLVNDRHKLRIDPDLFDAQLENFYQKIIDAEQTGDVSGFALSNRFAEGFHAFQEYQDKIRNRPMVKGQIIGPVSFGLNVPGRNDKPMIYDEVMRDALVKNLQMKARYQQAVLKKLNTNTLLFIDESSLDLIFGPFVGYDDIKARADLRAILDSIEGLKGIHCCINTDWAFLLEMVDVISFDAYRYSEQFLLYHSAIKRFMNEGGIIAWGIVPASDEVFNEDLNSVARRLETNIDFLADQGIERELLLKRSLITPVCGLGTTDMEITRRVFQLTRDVSDYFRQKYLS